jgi:predicted PurR-regulated permease PerM
MMNDGKATNSMNPDTSVTTEHRPAYLRVFYILALASLIVFILMVGSRLLIPVTMGAFFAMLLVPVSGWLERIRLGRFAGAFVPVLGLFLIFGLSAGLAVRQLSGIGSSFQGAADRVNDFVDRLNGFLSWPFGVDEPIVGEFDSEGVVNLVKDSSGALLSMADSVTEPFAYLLGNLPRKGRRSD